MTMSPFAGLRWLPLLAVAALALAAEACGGGAVEPPLPSSPAQPTRASGPSLEPTAPIATLGPTVGPAAAPTPTPIPSPTPTPEPTPEPTPPPEPVVEVSPEAVPQGGVFLLAVRHVEAQGASFSFAGRRYTMLRADNALWAVVGVPVDATPVSHSLRIVLEGSGGPLTAALEVTAVRFPVERLTFPPAAQPLLDTRLFEEDAAVLARVYSGLTPDRRWRGPFLMPVEGTSEDPFGIQRFANGIPLGQHTALDIAADEGAPVVAANAGRVAYVGTLPIRGNAVIIDHGAGVFSGYFHLSQVGVAEGQSVAKGAVIGAVGQTGLATGPHLHWEMVVREVRVDPLAWTRQALEP